MLWHYITVLSIVFSIYSTVILFQQVNSYVVPHIGNVKWFSVYSLSSVVFPLLMYACIQCTVYKEIFAPVFFLPLSPWSWSVGEFKTGCTNSNVFNYLFSKKKKSVWAISGQHKTVCKCIEGWKKHGVKTTLYTVYVKFT